MVWSGCQWQTMARRIRSVRIGWGGVYAVAWAFLASSTPVVAATAFTPASITNVAIYSGSSGGTGAYVVFSPGIPNLEGCSNAAGNQVWIDFTSTSEPTGKSLYATVLAAWFAGHTVAFEVNGCVDGGLLPLVYQVSITP